MAKRTITKLIDDVDGSDATETISFALDGVSYEIDLSDDNAAKLRDAFAVWTAHATRVGGRRRTGSAGSSGGKEDLEAIRQWARENGFKVADRGRISSKVKEAYAAAHG
ncbi:MAG: Lsr2 family protein [Actinomycetales bacterium]|nr:Lsr2 family protein [Tetrasphaera sp.]NLW98242.1 Lsr2 family protein [Actinomycetales bacterium]